MIQRFDTIVIGGGHAGVEAAWAAANLLSVRGVNGPARVALVSLDPSKIGVMSCNPAIGGLAKGQLVREIDALGGIMGLAADATGIQFKVLNSSKGAAVRGPRTQCDKHAYALAIQSLIRSHPNIQVIGASVERLLVDANGITGVELALAQTTQRVTLHARSVVLTTGTFMRGLMHTGEVQSAGGRFGERAAVGISAALKELGFELGRLKTGTPPRLQRGSINWNALEEQLGDARPVPFSDLSDTCDATSSLDASLQVAPSINRFPVLPQGDCRITHTNQAIHDCIRANLHRAPMYSGQIESIGPRYCPSLEDKVVRFAERTSHHVYLEPESLTDDWVYCNGISTSLPADVQETIVRNMPGCENAHIYRYGYAVEYDMVLPHQIAATAQTKLVPGLFLAGQINGTSGYEEAGAQGLLAGLNAARFACELPPVTLGRDQAYIGVLMDDLATKTPREPYRMFTSRAEHRLLLRADNAADRLTPLAKEWGLLAGSSLGTARWRRFEARRDQLGSVNARIDAARFDEKPLGDVLRRPEFTLEQLAEIIGNHWQPGVLFTAAADRFYSAYLKRAQVEIARSADMERRRIPDELNYDTLFHMRTEARNALAKFRPATLGQAARLEGLTPADVSLLGVLIKKARTTTG